MAHRSARSRVRANRVGIRATLVAAREAGWVRVARLDDSVVGAAIATPPGRWPLAAPPAHWRARVTFVQGLRTASRWAEAFDALAAHHPLERHWYLATLGVDPPCQGRGVGRALLDAFVACPDADGTPAWLETDQEKNLHFYEAVGFQVVGEVRVFDTPVWMMRRP